MRTKAARQAVIAVPERPHSIQLAIEDLAAARIRLRNCGCKKAANKAARAMKSAEGALRNAQLHRNDAP